MKSERKKTAVHAMRLPSVAHSWRGAQNQLMVAVISLVTIMGASAQDAASPPNLVPFSEFTQSIRSVQASTVMAASRAMVTNNATVEEMRQHLLSLYEGVSVSHSFVLGASCQ
jgi:hypothetical protein